MAQFTKLEGRRHRIAIAGRVIDGGTGALLSGAELRLTAMPEVLTKRLSIKALQYGASWETLAQRPDRTRSRQDGSFCFLDLPEGNYTVTAALPGVGTRYGSVSGETTVSAPVATGADASAGGSSSDGPEPLPALLELRLPPTGLRGVVTMQLDAEIEPVYLARLQIKGSGEVASSDADGQFVLNGLEPGARTLLASARGCQTVSIDVLLRQGDVTSVSVALEPVSGPQS